MVPVPDDPSRVAIRLGATGFHDNPDVRFYTLVGLNEDDRKILNIQARLGVVGPKWEEMQVYIMSIKGDPLPEFGLDVSYRRDPLYLDNIREAHYSRLDNGLFW